MIAAVWSLGLATAAPRPPEKDFSLDGLVTATTVRDPAWDRFAPGSDSMLAWGVRAGWRPASRVSLQASWGAVRRGVSVEASGFDTTVGVVAATGHQLTLGAQVDASLFDLLLPSFAVNGVALPMAWRFDGEPSVREDRSQFREWGVPVGVEALGGIELRLPPKEVVAVAAWFQLGGAVYSRGTFGDAGTMAPAGLVGRGGFGLRF